MGVVMSMVQPTVGEVKKTPAEAKNEVKNEAKNEKKPDDTSKIMLGPHPDAKKKETSETDSFSSSGGFKYLKEDGPRPSLGPTLGNKPTQSTVVGAPIIKPPTDTISEAPALSSVYDTLSMAPDVDWENKKIIQSPNEQKKTT